MNNHKGFTGEGQWYKGNLHSHSTVSDGMLTPEEVVALYQKNGYHFLSLSEHDIYSDYRDVFNTDDFIILPSVEYTGVLFRDIGTNERYKIHHMHGILGTKAMQEAATEGLYAHMQYIPPLKFFKSWNGAEVAQKMEEMLAAHGCVVTYNHPIWSRVAEADFLDTQGVSMVEIFNYNTVQESNTGYDVTYWDQMLRRGQRINAFASDDNHNEGLFEDSLGGWICVQAPALTHEDLITAILAGNYYSSAGPEILDWGICDGVAYVKCSAVNKINFVAGNIINDGVSILAKPRTDTLCGGHYPLKGHETYVRAEVTDRYGRTAWTNPIYLP